VGLQESGYEVVDWIVWIRVTSGSNVRMLHIPNIIWWILQNYESYNFVRFYILLLLPHTLIRVLSSPFCAKTSSQRDQTSLVRNETHRIVGVKIW
jgi:hypothetical protein